MLHAFLRRRRFEDASHGAWSPALTKHIGIVGVSPEGAALFYREVSRQAGRLIPPTEQPRISLHNEPLEVYIDAIRREDWHSVGRLLRKSADLLSRCGAEFCLTPDNAVQHAIQLAEVGSPIPWLTMTDLVAQKLVKDGRRQVGVIGTRLVTRSSTYQTPLGLKGVRLMMPSDDEVELLEQVIYGELIFGSARPESQAAMLGVIRNLAAAGCEGVILGASEVPLVITAENSVLPVYDPAEILAEATVRRALSDAPKSGGVRAVS
jgi:aspartate racemase